MPISLATQKQYKNFVRDAKDRALEEIQLDKQELELLMAHGDMLSQRFAGAIRELSLSSLFASDEVKSHFAYPASYGVKEVGMQVAILRDLFSELKNATYDESIVTRPHPRRAEGWFAIPRWQKLSSFYNAALDRIFEVMEAELMLCNFRQGQTGPEYLRQCDKTAKAFLRIGNEQKGHDILIVPCQFGRLHRDRSVRRALEVMNVAQFGLNAFAAGCMLLTHPEREKCFDQLHIDCAGDEFSPKADGDFTHSPAFEFLAERLTFSAYRSSDKFIHCGSASGFLMHR